MIGSRHVDGTKLNHVEHGADAWSRRFTRDKWFRLPTSLRLRSTTHEPSSRRRSF
jgi:hypothetical protein